MADISLTTLKVPTYTPYFQAGAGSIAQPWLEFFGGLSDGINGLLSGDSDGLLVSINGAQVTY